MVGTLSLESVDHRNFCGYVSPYDYCTDCPRVKNSPSWASRIISDWKFDKKCREEITRKSKLKKNREAQNE